MHINNLFCSNNLYHVVVIGLYMCVTRMWYKKLFQCNTQDRDDGYFAIWCTFIVPNPISSKHFFTNNIPIHETKRSLILCKDPSLFVVSTTPIDDGFPRFKASVFKEHKQRISIFNVKSAMAGYSIMKEQFILLQQMHIC